MSGQSFPKPLPLLMSTSDGLKLNEETANILAKITQPVVVVAIAGKYRSGKSYILNLFSHLPRGSGFELGDTVESFTKGIWVYALPHPKIENTTLVLLDTEGLHDVDKGDLHYENTLLVLTILLSSTFILNVTGRLDDEVIKQLGFVSMLTKSMTTKASDVQKGKDFGLFFPRVVVLEMDFCLELISHGKEVTADHYINEYCLKIQDKSANNFEKYNEPRKMIRKYFPKRNCVTLPMPVVDGQLLHELEKVPDDKLNPAFLKESKDFIEKMLTVSEPKTLTEKAKVNGAILVTLLRNYLEQIKDGAVPCIETTLQSTARVENEKLLQEFITAYSVKMREVLNLPSSLVFITETHQTISQQLADEFKQSIIFDDENNELEKKYTKEVNDTFNEIIKENDEASKRECENRLKSLCVTLDSKLNDMFYYKPGGYSEYSKDLHDVIENYNRVEEKGVKHEEVLCNFFSERYHEGNQIYSLDEQMSELERKAEEAQREKEHAEQIAKLQQKHVEQTKKQLEEIKRTYEETQKQLQRELEERNKKQDELLKLSAEISRSSPPKILLCDKYRMSVQPFPKPLPLLLSTSDGLKLNEETANILAKITQPVVVVAIAGKYRSGKSYILNLFSDLPRGSGFELGDTVYSFTKGIWVYALPHPKIKNTTLVLLDTKGLRDVDKGDRPYETTLLVLTILLSSTFILNVTGKLDDEVIKQLGFVSMLTKSNKTKATDVETGIDFNLFLPRLVVLVRDFCLQLKIHGKEVTADHYFNEYCLKIKNTSANNFERYNEPRKLIRKYFPKRNCVTLPLPVYNRKLLRELEKVPDDKLNPRFLKKSKDFIEKMLTVSEPKTLTEKSKMNGTILVTLLRNYLEQIKNGAVPCIETTLQSTARVENEKLLQEFITAYSVKMREVLNLPSSLVFITETHQTICQQLTDEFKQRIIFDDENNEFEKKYTKEVNDTFNAIIEENNEASKRECENRLKSLCVTLDSKLNDKVYYKPGGYSEYSKDLHDVIENYNKVEEKGVKHVEVFCNFLAERYREGNQISSLNEQMSDLERNAEEAQREKEHAEQIAKLQQKHVEQTKKQLEEIKRTYEETQKQLQRELEERNKKQDELLKLSAEISRSSPPNILLSNKYKMSVQPFPKPLPLLLSTSDGLKLNEETANILAKITQPVVVVAIAGKYRSGKSYILNLFSDLPRNSGFELGDTVESFTKGIWVYALPHPKIKNTTLVLLDTEGLGDVDKGDLHYETTLLVLTILLSSTFILNVTGRLDDEVIKQLGFVSMLTKSMTTKANNVETGEDFNLFFPRLVVLVRDFCLELIIHGKKITADHYFNKYCLKIKNKSGNNFEKYNEPRKLIRKYFPKRNCVTLPMPVFDGQLLHELEKVPDDKLNPAFLEESKDFIEKMLTVSEPKTLTQKARVNGTILVTLLRKYLEQIKNGAVPCIETTIQSTARVENEKLLQEFITAYSVKMREVLNLPSSLVFITEKHQTTCQQLTDEFKQRIIFDDENNELEKKYTKELNDAFNEIIKENEEASKRECENRLKSLRVTLDSKLNDKVYYKPGGYSEYSKDLHDVIENYNKVEEKGVKHEEVLCNFVDERYREGNLISALDEHMSDTERKAEEAQREKEHAEQIARMEQEYVEKTKIQMEEMIRTYEETQKQLQRELEERIKKHEELLKLLAERSNPPPPPKRSGGFCVIS